MKKEIIGMKPFERMRAGQRIAYPVERASTVHANLAKVRLKYPERVYVVARGKQEIHVIREK